MKMVTGRWTLVWVLFVFSSNIRAENFYDLNHLNLCCDDQNKSNMNQSIFEESLNANNFLSENALDKSFINIKILNRGPDSNKTDEQFRFWKPSEFKYQTALGYDAFAFEVPKSLESQVRFWIKIYTQYTTKQGVFHKSGNTDEILGEIDLTDIYLNPQWGKNRKAVEAEKLIKRQRKFFAAKHGIKNIKTVRLQMGLKDRTEEAIQISGLYMPMMEDVFKKEGIPLELLRVVFVESSFNNKALSRAGAAGLWQIMPNVAKKLRYLNENQDLRYHPYYSTKIAAKILKQNYQILKSWPLAVTSYNFGVGSMLKVKKKLGQQNLSDFFDQSKNKNLIGFASSNFYATFLAALHVETHANLYFGDPFKIYNPMTFKSVTLDKKIVLNDFLNKNDLSHLEFKKLNPHIKNKLLGSLKSKLPSGIVINLPSKDKVAENN